MLKKGQKLNKYQLLELIGEGGEAQIWRAVDTFTNEELALRVIHQHHIRLAPEITSLFLREGEILSKIDDPRIIKIYESNVAVIDEKEYYYHAMELVHASDLGSYLENNKPGWQESLRIFMAVMKTVVFLHEMDDPILHRDLKPANIFLMDAGDVNSPTQVKIFDFGLARREFEKTITAADAFRGTLKFSAPELRDVGGKASTASEIYSLGVT
ncbi:serine/threonine protein kinase, partial [bacterium]|nr:serine/threonine protein kinase [bacterium]MBU1025748.1 serine/threonine protein kinase [bacterium]